LLTYVLKYKNVTERAAALTTIIAAKVMVGLESFDRLGIYKN